MFWYRSAWYRSVLTDSLQQKPTTTSCLQFQLPTKQCIILILDLHCLHELYDCFLIYCNELFYFGSSVLTMWPKVTSVLL